MHGARLFTVDIRLGAVSLNVCGRARYTTVVAAPSGSPERAAAVAERMLPNGGLLLADPPEGAVHRRRVVWSQVRDTRLCHAHGHRGLAAEGDSGSPQKPQCLVDLDHGAAVPL